MPGPHRETPRKICARRADRGAQDLRTRICDPRHRAEIDADCAAEIALSRPPASGLRRSAPVAPATAECGDTGFRTSCDASTSQSRRTRSTGHSPCGADGGDAVAVRRAADHTVVLIRGARRDREGGARRCPGRMGHAVARLDLHDGTMNRRFRTGPSVLVTTWASIDLGQRPGGDTAKHRGHGPAGRVAQGAWSP
jgi:hypothetical protein